MSLTSSRIRALNAVYEAGTLSGAARMLKVSQPAVSQQIRELESAYRVKLFDRRHGQLIPTALCRELTTVTGRIQEAERAAAAILSNAQAVAGGELRVGLGNMMPGLRLARTLMQWYPNIALRIEIGNWAAIIDGVGEQRIDVGVLPRVPGDGRFRRQICIAKRVVAVAPAAGPLSRQTRTNCEELARHPLIFRSRPSSTQIEVDDAFRRAGIVPKPAITLDTRDGVLEAVVHGMGIGFIWEEASLRTGDVAKLRIDEIQSDSHEYIFCRTDNRDRLVDLFFSCSKVLQQTGQPAP